MPWYGQIRSVPLYCHCRHALEWGRLAEHPAGGPGAISEHGGAEPWEKWITGAVRNMCLQKTAISHNDLCKIYRSYVKDTVSVTLEEKGYRVLP